MMFKYAVAIMVMGGVPVVCGKQHLRGPRHRYLQEKWTAAQQRLYERDKRRKYTNPYRTQAEEDAERLRMHENGLYDPRRDPYNRQYGDHEYAYFREQRFREDCRLLGINCNVHALDYDPADRLFDYDALHDEYYRGTPYDPYPHDTTHRITDPLDPAYYPIDYGPYTTYDRTYVYDPTTGTYVYEPSVLVNPTSVPLGVDPASTNKNFRYGRYAQYDAREHLRNCELYGTDCDQFAFLPVNEAGQAEPGAVRCTGSRCTTNSNLFTIAAVEPADNDTTDGDVLTHDAAYRQKVIEQHMRDCRERGVNCDVADLENDNIGYVDEHDSAPYDHEIYDYYRDEVAGGN
ncbi:hypothetical protein ACHAWU_003128 [Discostella pseudostelligera]|uniref:Uncharacterized protein n=1 Tax=Discostella pseudostelligera TaxID=259834 RepID=A0ABD3MA73_9STRA